MNPANGNPRQFDAIKAQIVTVAEMIAAGKEHSAVRKAEGNEAILAAAVEMVVAAGYNKLATEYFVQNALENYKKES